MMPAREDISDLRAGVRFWLFLNVWIHGSRNAPREMTRFYLVGGISAIIYVITSLSLFLDLRVISTLSRADTVHILYMSLCYRIHYSIDRA